MGRRQVLVGVRARHEVPVRPRLRVEHVRVGALRQAPRGSVLIGPQHAVVRHAVEVDAHEGAGSQAPVVLEAPEAPAVAVLVDLVHVEPAHRPALLLGERVAILGRAAHAAAREVVQRERGVLAVGDRPEERDLRREALARRGPEVRREEARLALAADRGGEERHERDEGHVLEPERDVRAVDQLVEVGGRVAEPERPRGRLLLARREDAAADVVDALAEPLHALAADAVVRRDLQAPLVDHAGAGLEVVLDAVAGQAVLAVVEDHAPQRGRVARLAVHLDAVGEQARRPARDLDVTRRHDQVVGPRLLEPVGDDRHVRSGGLHGRDRRRLGGRRGGTR